MFVRYTTLDREKVLSPVPSVSYFTTSGVVHRAQSISSADLSSAKTFLQFLIKPQEPVDGCDGGQSLVIRAVLWCARRYADVFPLYLHNYLDFHRMFRQYPYDRLRAEVCAQPEQIGTTVC